MMRKLKGKEKGNEQRKKRGGEQIEQAAATHSHPTEGPGLVQRENLPGSLTATPATTTPSPSAHYNTSTFLS